MVRVNKIREVLASVLVALFLCYWASSTLFIHTHVMQEGTITHSHPYSSGSHTHSGASLSFFNHLNAIVAVVAVAVALGAVLAHTNVSFNNLSEVFPKLFSVRSLTTRGPPSVVA